MKCWFLHFPSLVWSTWSAFFVRNHSVSALFGSKRSALLSVSQQLFGLCWFLAQIEVSDILCSIFIQVLLVVSYSYILCCFLILVAARGAVSRQFDPFLLSLYSTTSDFVVLDLTVRGLVASLWIYPLHFFMYYLRRLPGSVGVTQRELPGGPPSAFELRPQ